LPNFFDDTAIERKKTIPLGTIEPEVQDGCDRFFESELFVPRPCLILKAKPKGAILQPLPNYFI
jgi:hypothetical protein